MFNSSHIFGLNWHAKHCTRLNFDLLQLNIMEVATILFDIELLKQPAICHCFDHHNHNGPIKNRTSPITEIEISLVNILFDLCWLERQTFKFESNEKLDWMTLFFPWLTDNKSSIHKCNANEGKFDLHSEINRNCGSVETRKQYKRQHQISIWFDDSPNEHSQVLRAFILRMNKKIHQHDEHH